ncbi:serine/threonine protein kinase [bacterium CPR1]|nr:serine/threonine protein kinase [bacterium CPR1]
MALQPGVVVGDRYRILRPLHSRKNGSTYLAEDCRLGGSHCVLRECAVPELPSSELMEILAWFEEEKRLLTRVQHPSLARLRDFHYLNGLAYIVTDFVEGVTLEQELAECMAASSQPVPAEELIYQILDVLEVLDEMHGLEPPILHGDIKPANLIRDATTGSVRLVGYGLARPGPRPPMTAQAAGGYSPLELTQGRADARSDLYSLGATLSQLLSGEPPVPLGIPPLLDLYPEAEEELASLIDRACAFLPEKRFQSAREMGEALQSWLERKGTFLPTALSVVELSEPVAEELASESVLEPGPLEPGPIEPVPWGGLPPLAPAEPRTVAPARPFTPSPPAEGRSPAAGPPRWVARPRPPVFPKRTEGVRHQVVPPRLSGASFPRTRSVPAVPVSSSDEIPVPIALKQTPSPPAAPEGPDEEVLGGVPLPSTEDEESPPPPPPRAAQPEKATKPAQGGASESSGRRPAPSSPEKSSSGKPAAVPEKPSPGKLPAPSAEKRPSSEKQPASSRESRTPAPTPTPIHKAVSSAPEVEEPAPRPMRRLILLLILLLLVLVAGYQAGRYTTRHDEAPIATPGAPSP